MYLGEEKKKDTYEVQGDDGKLYQMPIVVKQFMIDFRNTINEGFILEVYNMYETTYPKLTKQYFDKSPWPEESIVAHLVDNDQVSIVLYKELYYRHINARVPGGLSLEQRIKSFYNYCSLFDFILSADEPLSLELPDLWLWELLDEFINQFHSFTQYRACLKTKTPEELDTLKRESDAWNVLYILNVLHSLIDRSNIKMQLEVYASGGDPNSVAGRFGQHSLYKILGFYSLVELLRLHSLLGDYYQAIKVLEIIELHAKFQFPHVPACQISTSYYGGIACTMTRRYSDAIRTVSSALLCLKSANKLFTVGSYQYDQNNKHTEQMYHLLAICLVLDPQCIDKSIQQELRDNYYHLKMVKMQHNALYEFEICFKSACPKFLSPSTPDANAPIDDYSENATKHQTKVFMDEVRQQKIIPTIRSYLKLYTSLPLSKLATFIAKNQRGEKWDLEKEMSDLRIHLLCLKHKMKKAVSSNGACELDGSELDFYVDNDMIHIAGTVPDHYDDHFIPPRHLLDEEEFTPAPPIVAYMRLFCPILVNRDPDYMVPWVRFVDNDRPGFLCPRNFW